MTLGMTGLFLTGDVFSFYVFFELAMISRTR
jgi:formate hydrogenlyase subunit 3/multisubunit Na+/H+ antiporter MnhD subunit